MTDTAIVIIGRNEGGRLRMALASVREPGTPVVYVDSASTDGSTSVAAAAGATVIALPNRPPLTAARARNAGFERVREAHPDVAYVQFLDGDSSLAPGWIETARAFLESNPDVAVVAGRVRERERNASVYNRLCDLEWDAPAGNVRSCGGMFLARAAAFAAVSGFDPQVIAGEEADFCARIRAEGHRIHRIAEEMALHDAGMTRFGQWWRRAYRSGHAYAEAWARRGRREAPNEARQVKSFLLWGGLASLVALSGFALGIFVRAAFAIPALVVLAWFALGVRIYGARRRRGDPAGDARDYALFCVLAKIPQTLGALRYLWSRILRRPTPLIEHKGAAARPAEGASK